MHKRGLQPALFPVGQPDVSTQKIDADFGGWLNSCIAKAPLQHSRNTPILKLWHLDGSLEAFSNKQALFTFYELDSPTQLELNVARNQSKVIVSSNFTKGIFEDCGADNIECIPLGFDSANFSTNNKKFFSDDRIVFLSVGKFEHRKQHEKAIKAWIKKYGNNPEYFLQCAVYNPFFSPEENEAIVKSIVGGKNYFNVQFIGYMQQNELYNNFLASGNIILGMSGGEGWGLGEFHALAMGKHGVILNAHAHKEWATAENSVLVKPNGKQPAYDGKFFVEGRPTNQGNIFSWAEDDFLNACDEAIARVKKNRINEAGLKLREKFTWAKTTDQILKVIEAI